MEITNTKAQDIGRYFAMLHRTVVKMIVNKKELDGIKNHKNIFVYKHNSGKVCQFDETDKSHFKNCIYLLTAIIPKKIYQFCKDNNFKLIKVLINQDAYDKIEQCSQIFAYDVNSRQFHNCGIMKKEWAPNDPFEIHNPWYGHNDFIVVSNKPIDICTQNILVVYKPGCTLETKENVSHRFVFFEVQKS